MRIAVISHGLRVAGAKSVGTNIVGALPRVRPEHDYYFVIPEDPDYRAVLRSRDEVLGFAHRSYPQRLLFDQRILPERIARFAPEAVFSLGNMGIPVRGAFQAVLFHTAQLVYPRHHWGPVGLSDDLWIQLVKRRLRRSLRYTNLVFCQTDVVRRRFRQEFSFDGDVCLLPNAISSAIIQSFRAASLEQPHDRRPLRLLALSRYYPHKNLELIVSAFEHHREELRGVEVTLTIAPDQHPRAAALLERVERLGLTSSIRNLGPIPQETIAVHFLASDGLLLPTLLESFSGTYLEAMSLGRPVLTSDLDFARATCGGAALYFDPWSPAGLAASICRLRDDSSVRWRLSSAGLRRAGAVNSSWDEIVGQAMGEIESRMQRSAC